MGLQDAGGGVMQAILNAAGRRCRTWRCSAGSRPKPAARSYSLLQIKGPNPDDWKDLLALTERANREGIKVTAQVFPRPVGVLLGLDASYHPFSAHPAYLRIADLPLAARVAEMRRPEVRAAILADTPEARGMIFFAAARMFETIYPLGSPPNYEPAPRDSIAARAEAQGRTPDEVAYDLLLEDDGRALLLQTISNYADGNLDAVHGMLTAPHTVPALGDGGAHYGMICDSSYPTYLLSYWGRDRTADRIEVCHRSCGR